MAACVQWTRPPRHVDESSMVDTAHATGHSEDVVASTAHITYSGTKICRHMHNSEKKDQSLRRMNKVAKKHEI